MPLPRADFNPFRAWWWKNSGDPVEDMTEAVMTVYGRDRGWDETEVRKRLTEKWIERCRANRQPKPA